jgi:hypothetical protein
MLPDEKFQSNNVGARTSLPGAKESLHSCVYRRTRFQLGEGGRGTHRLRRWWRRYWCCRDDLSSVYNLTTKARKRTI